MATISSSSVPRGVRSVTTSPTDAFSSAVAMGEIHETRPRAGIELVDADDADGPFDAGFVGDGDGGAEVDPVVGLAGIVHHHGTVQALRQEADAAVDLAQLALAVDVVAVLGAIAVAGRPRDRVDELRPVDLPEPRRARRSDACAPPA